MSPCDRPADARSPSDRASEEREARRIAVSLGFGLMLFAVLSYASGHALRAGICLGLAGLVALGAGFRLTAWAIAARLLSGVALALARGVSRLVLCAVFYGLMTPMGLARRLLRRRPLDTAWKDGRASYWREARQVPSTLTRYLKQY